jgi:hypothetical protein
MVEVLQEAKTKTANRHAGGEISRNPGSAPAANAPMPTPTLLKRVGSSLYGTHWQADLAREIEFSKAQITRWLNKSRTMPAALPLALQQVVLDRIIVLAGLLEEGGMPQDEKVTRAAAKIRSGAKSIKVEAKVEED